MKTGIEWQVSSLTLSQRLRELGVKQESIFHRATYEFNKTVWELFSQAQTAVSAPVDFYSAFTVAELLQILEQYEFLWSFDHSIKAEEVADNLAEKIISYITVYENRGN